MISAALFTTLLEHPISPIRQAIASPFIRRFLIGVATGLAAIAIFYSPWGKQSAAHLNPAVILTVFRLEKVKPWDALFTFCFSVAFRRSPLSQQYFYSFKGFTQRLLIQCS
jgi:aquaporin Z